MLLPKFTSPLLTLGPPYPFWLGPALPGAFWPPRVPDIGFVPLSPHAALPFSAHQEGTAPLYTPLPPAITNGRHVNPPPVTNRLYFEPAQQGQEEGVSVAALTDTEDSARRTFGGSNHAGAAPKKPPGADGTSHRSALRPSTPAPRVWNFPWHRGTSPGAGGGEAAAGRAQQARGSTPAGWARGSLRRPEGTLPPQPSGERNPPTALRLPPGTDARLHRFPPRQGPAGSGKAPAPSRRPSGSPGSRFTGGREGGTTTGDGTQGATPARPPADRYQGGAPPRASRRARPRAGRFPAGPPRAAAAARAAGAGG